MSRDAQYIESCLEKLANGDYSLNMADNILKKNNSAGRMARLIKIIAENEYSKSEKLEMLADGSFGAVEQMQPETNTGSSLKKAAAAFNSINQQLISIADAVAGGDASARIDESALKGDFKQTGAAINRLLDAVLVPAVTIEDAVKAMSQGNFAVRIGDDVPGISSELADAINSLNGNFEMINNLSEKAANGDFADAEEIEQIKSQAGGNKAISSLIETIKNINSLKDAVSSACVSKTALNTADYTGAYKAIADGVNIAFSSNEDKLNEISDVLNAMSVNDLTVELGEGTKAEFAGISDSIDKLRSHFAVIVNVVKEISQGEFANIKKLMDSGKLSDNDELTPALSDFTNIIKNIVEGSSEMANAVRSGDLMYRMDTESVSGRYAEIFENFNNAFDALAMPVIEMSAVLENLATGNTRQKVTGEFTGVFETLKNDVNTISSMTKELIDMITDTLNKISNGNLDIPKLKELSGDWNGVPAALNNIVDSLNVLVGNIYNAVDEVTAGANQVSIGSQELSQGATEQASSIEELTSSIAEIASQTKLNAQNANKASALAKTMRDSAISGNEAMNEMLTSMQEINESSRNISKIIKVIDDIAFQTNILALNAAVEAARAGENGKGFAVVAEEVRNLAARSANAAKDTTSLIEGSIDRVEKGTKIAATTAKTLGNIVDGVDKVAGLVENIAVASNDQATAITQVNQGLEQVSKVVQTNSATAEESAAASEELSGQASMLKSSVQKFTLREETKHYMHNSSAEAEAASGKANTRQQIDLTADFGKY